MLDKVLVLWRISNPHGKRNTIFFNRCLLFLDKNKLDQAEKCLQEAAQANLVSILNNFVQNCQKSTIT
jgi:hypothetical protein